MPQHKVRYVQAQVRDRQSNDVVGPRRIPVPAARAQQEQTAEGGAGYDSLSLLLSLARRRRLHALLHAERPGDAQVGDGVQVSV